VTGSATGSTQDEPRTSGIAQLTELFDIEELDRNLFRGQNPSPPQRTVLYGGHVAAQAVLAASRTVDSHRVPHSLHGYFLRPGQVDRPTIFQVNCDRDGRSFSSRHVVALQDGLVILSLSVSFHLLDDGVEYESEALTDVPEPDSCAAADPRGMLREWMQMFELRLPTPDRQMSPSGQWTAPTQLWCRTAAPIGDDPYLHAAIVTYVSDLSTGFANAALPIEPFTGGPSLDHALWLHRPVDPQEWFLLDLEPIVAAGGRGLYHGTILDQRLRRCASIAQEVLTRAPRAR